jgi:hypothetical protein
MNLRWNPNLRRFEVEFHNFTEEQPLVKAAGFKTDGAPEWVWYSYKSEALTKLRENRPSILNINQDARTEYAALKVVEDLNAATKAQFAEHKKALKKKLKEDKQDAARPGEFMDEELGFICLKVEPKPFKRLSEYIPPPPPETTCFICSTPVYSYEYGETQNPSCLWCRKIVLDNTEEVC